MIAHNIAYLALGKMIHQQSTATLLRSGRETIKSLINASLLVAFFSNADLILRNGYTLARAAYNIAPASRIDKR